MSESQGIKYSQFQVTDVTFDGKNWPTSVNLASYYLRNISNSNVGVINLTATLTKEESVELMRVLNDIATRIEKQLSDSLKHFPDAS